MCFPARASVEAETCGKAISVTRNETVDCGQLRCQWRPIACTTSQASRRRHTCSGGGARGAGERAERSALRRSCRCARARRAPSNRRAPFCQSSSACTRNLCAHALSRHCMSEAHGLYRETGKVGLEIIIPCCVQFVWGRERLAMARSWDQLQRVMRKRSASTLQWNPSSQRVATWKRQMHHDPARQPVKLRYPSADLAAAHGAAHEAHRSEAISEVTVRMRPNDRSAKHVCKLVLSAPFHPLVVRLSRGVAVI